MKADKCDKCNGSVNILDGSWVNEKGKKMKLYCGICLRKLKGEVKMKNNQTQLDF